MGILFLQGFYLYKLTYRVLCIFYIISGSHSGKIYICIPIYISEYSHKATLAN